MVSSRQPTFDHVGLLEGTQRADTVKAQRSKAVCLDFLPPKPSIHHQPSPVIKLYIHHPRKEAKNCINFCTLYTYTVCMYAVLPVLFQVSCHNNWVHSEYPMQFVCVCASAWTHNRGLFSNVSFTNRHKLSRDPV